MATIPSGELRSHLAEYLNRAAYGSERLIIERHGKEIAALISYEDFRLFTALLRSLEDAVDTEEAQVAMKEQESIRLQTLKKELGL